MEDRQGQIPTVAGGTIHNIIIESTVETKVIEIFLSGWEN